MGKSNVDTPDEQPVSNIYQLPDIEFRPEHFDAYLKHEHKFQPAHWLAALGWLSFYGYCWLFIMRLLPEGTTGWWAILFALLAVLFSAAAYRKD